MTSLFLVGIGLSTAPVARASVCSWAGEACFPLFKNCCTGYVCDLLILGKCRHDPPLLHEPCSIFSGCKDPKLNYCKGFQEGLAGECVPFRRVGESCVPLYDMCGNIHNPNRTCSVIPADIANPMPFQNELVCYPLPTPLSPGGLGFDPFNDEECRDQWSPDVHRNVFSSGKARSYSAGWGVAALFAATAEVGVVYGPDGRFGCYRETCTGAQSSVGLFNYVVAGEYKSYDDFKAASYVHAKGASIVAGYSVGHAYRSAEDFNQDDETLNALGSLAASSIGVDVMMPFGAYEWMNCTNEMNREYTWDGNTWNDLRPYTGPPKLLCQDTVVHADPVSCTAAANISKYPGTEGVAVVQFPAGPYGIGTSSVILRPVDAEAATSCEAMVEVLDRTEPSIQCPSSLLTQECQTNGAATVVFPSLHVTDCSSYQVHPPDNQVFPLGTTAVSFTVEDTSSNSARCDTAVTVVDTRPPVIGSTTPSVFAAECTSPQGTSVGLQASVEDVCDTAPAIAFSPGGPYPLGTTAVTLRAVDASGNEATRGVSVVVSDTTAPQLVDIPAPITVEQKTLAGTPVLVTAPWATDICDAAPRVVSDAPSVFPLGTTTVAFTATDASGNQGAASTAVTVVDRTAPAIASVRPSLEVLWPPNHELVPVHVAVDVMDACDAAPECRIVAVDLVESSRVAAKATGSTSPGATSLGPAWEILGDLDVALRAERSGTSTGRTYGITVRCTDASGNATTSQVQVSVPHDAS